MSSMYLFDTVQTQLGLLTIVVDRSGALTELFTSDATAKLSSHQAYRQDPKAVEEPRRQLEEYARGVRREFTLELAPLGSSFQKAVWEQLMLIPYGETRTYGQLATILGKPNGSRAVGRANATNPIGIVVPCHRLIGHNGDLTGYAGGLPLKRKLLELEGFLKPMRFDICDSN